MNNRGFACIELLLVIFLIGVVAGIVCSVLEWSVVPLLIGISLPVVLVGMVAVSEMWSRHRSSVERTE